MKKAFSKIVHGIFEFINLVLAKGMALTLFVTLLLINLQTKAQGTWTRLNNQPSAPFGSVMILLSDGSVAVKTTTGGVSDSSFNGTPGNIWLRLVPDSTGSYINGTWSSMAPMNYTRHDFSSAILKDGRLYVAGGEYGTGMQYAEIYNPVTDSWSVITNNPLGEVKDANCMVLENGKVLQYIVGDYLNQGQVAMFDPISNSYINYNYTNLINYDQDEDTWVKLADNSILAPSYGGTTSERYIPSLGKWIKDASPVNNIWGIDGEMGPGFLLPDKRVFYMGANGQTEYYTPSGDTTMGTWTRGPDVPGLLGADDAGADFLVNGKILFALGPTPYYDSATATNYFYNSPTTFFEFDYTNNVFTQIPSPNLSADYNSPTFECNFLQLPDGSVLFGQMYASDQFSIYTPSGSPISAGRPTIKNMVQINCDTFAVYGTGFNGLNSGACYGDDSQNSSNYPLVRLSSGTNVYYARTFNWNSTSVLQGDNPDSTEFSIPNGIPKGNYSMVVSVNGFISDTVNFFYSPCTKPIDSLPNIKHDSTPSADTLFTIFPNPTQNTITITGISSNSSIIVNDLIGRQLFTLNASNSKEMIDLSRFSNGIYLVRIINANNKSSRTFKILKY